MNELPYVNLHKHCAGGTDFTDFDGLPGWAICGNQPDYLIRRLKIEQANPAGWVLVADTVAACWIHSCEIQHMYQDDRFMLSTQAFNLATGKLISSDISAQNLAVYVGASSKI